MVGTPLDSHLDPHSACRDEPSKEVTAEATFSGEERECRERFCVECQRGAKGTGTTGTSGATEHHRGHGHHRGHEGHWRRRDATRQGPVNGLFRT